MDWATGVGFPDVMKSSGETYGSAHEYRQRYVIAALMAAKGIRR